MILFGSGHRNIGSYSNSALIKMIELLEDHLIVLNPSRVVVGGALGFDTALAIAAIRKQIAISLIMPFPGFDARWPDTSRARLEKIISRADEVVYLARSYDKAAYFKRNELLVDRSDRGLVYFSGDYKTGTGHCIRYATSKLKPFTNVYEEWSLAR